MTMTMTRSVKDGDMPNLAEMDRTVALATQLEEDGGPVVLVNTFVATPEDDDRLVAAWAADAAFMKRQPGFISTQLHRGIAGSGVFLNYAVWESVEQFWAAFSNPEFQARLADYPERTTVSPHLFRPIAISGICVA
jgi:heme-degrading monooxygenase HmoA